MQRYASVSCGSQKPLPFSESVPGTRRSSAPILDTLRKRTDLQDFLEGLRQTSASTGSSSFMSEEQEPNVPKTDSLSENMNTHFRSPAKSFRRNSEVHPRYCQACVALLLGVKSGGSLGHVPSPSTSPAPKPSFLPHQDSSSHTHQLHNAVHNTSFLHNSNPSSIPVQITPPSPVHSSHAHAQNTPSPLHISVPSPVDPPSPLRSSSPVARGPHSPSLRDRSDLSHLHHCLHHIVSRRTSSPVLMDHIDVIRQAQSTSSLCVPLSHQDTGSFSVKDSQAGPGLVVGDVK